MQYKRVALVSVSSAYDEQKIKNIKNVFMQKGYQVNDHYLNQVISDFGYVNTDKARVQSLIGALLDDNVDILWFVRGGRGAFNLYPYLYAKIDKLKAVKPKILVGFSDVTAIHSFVNEYLQWPSVHGVLAAFNKEMQDPNTQDMRTNDLEPIPSIESLFTDGITYPNILPLNNIAKHGAQGQLRGGNQTLVAASFSTIYQPHFSGKVLLLEDVGEVAQKLDRSLHQMLFMKDFHVNAILFGRFYKLNPIDEDRLIFKAVIENFAQKFSKPVYYYPFIGHGRENKPLILGADISISNQDPSGYCSLQQKPVRLKYNH